MSRNACCSIFGDRYHIQVFSPTSPWSDLYDNHSRWIKETECTSLISRRWVYDDYRRVKKIPPFDHWNMVANRRRCRLGPWLCARVSGRCGDHGCQYAWENWTSEIAEMKDWSQMLPLSLCQAIRIWIRQDSSHCAADYPPNLVNKVEMGNIQKNSA